MFKLKNWEDASQIRIRSYLFSIHKQRNSEIVTEIEKAVAYRSKDTF